MKISNKWQPIQAACAQAYARNELITPRQWLREYHPELRWRTAERFLSIPRLKTFLASDWVGHTPAENNIQDPLSPKQFPKKCGRVGAPYGNRNAMKHGVYSKFLTDDEEKMREQILGIEHVKHELALARVLIARALKKQSEIERARKNEQQNGKPALCAMNIVEFELLYELQESRRERRKWVLPNIDATIDRLLKRTAQLAAINNKVEQMPELKGMEQLAFIQSVLYCLQEGKMSALEAGIKIESQLIPLPTTLAMMIQSELIMGSNESIGAGGVNGEQVKERAMQLKVG